MLQSVSKWLSSLTLTVLKFAAVLSCLKRVKSMCIILMQTDAPGTVRRQDGEAKIASYTASADLLSTFRKTFPSFTARELP